MSKAKIGHQARKRFGQNFLHDDAVIQKIIRGVAPKVDDHMVEIGPGKGALTELLLQQAGGKLDVIELDRDLIPILRTKFFNCPDLRIHEADALKFDFARLLTSSPDRTPEAEIPDEAKLRVVGNLPYNISTPLIFHLLDQLPVVRDMHFMLQKEVVDRMAASRGEKSYGKLGIMVQYYCRVQPLFVVPPGAFFPRPKVDSAIVRLVPHKAKPAVAKDPRVLNQVVAAGFNMRRKTIRNSLSSLVSEQQLLELDLDPKLRAENLTLSDYVAISNAITPGNALAT